MQSYRNAVQQRGRQYAVWEESGIACDSLCVAVPQNHYHHTMLVPSSKVVRVGVVFPSMNFYIIFTPIDSEIDMGLPSSGCFQMLQLV